MTDDSIGTGIVKRIIQKGTQIIYRIFDSSTMSMIDVDSSYVELI